MSQSLQRSSRGGAGHDVRGVTGALLPFVLGSFAANSLVT